MKENDFDIFVRNTLSGAEETVSPKVWEGVSKAIGKPRRVFPLWARWSSAAAVAAALVAEHVERAIAEEAVEILRVIGFMARKVFTVRVLEEGIAVHLVPPLVASSS